MSIVAASGIRVCERFTLLGKLGEGGEAEVWRARDHERGKDIALKILRPEVAQRPGALEALERQHEISVRLDHPLVLRVDPPVRDGEVVALPMELAPGGDLRRLCGVSYLEIVPVLIEVAQALARAHERGIVHRDLKPGNVLFDARGHVRLTDFAPASGAASPFTASPQQLRGEPPTVADDIYGLGALAYELLSGHPPYHPRFEMRRVLEEPVPPLKPAHLAPGRLVTFVMSMLAKRPSARPASMAEVIETLDAALNDTLTFAYDEPPDALASQAVVATAHITAPPVRRPLVSPLPEMPPEPVPPAAPPPATIARAAPPSQPAAATAVSGHAPERVVPRPEPSARPIEGLAASPPPPPPPPMTAPPRAERIAPESGLHAVWADVKDVKVERVPNLMRLEPVHRPRWPWVLAAAIAALAAAAFLLQQRSAEFSGALAPSGLARLHWLAPPKVVQAVRGVVDGPMRAIANRAARRPSDQTHDRPAPGPAGPAGGQGDSTHGGQTPGAPAGEQVGSAAASVPTTVPPATRGGPLAAAAGKTEPAASTTAATTGANGAAGVVVRPYAAASGVSRTSTVAAPTAVAAPTIPAAPRSRATTRPIAGVRQLLADAREAERARDYSRAAQDYSQALMLDPGDTAARAGLQRANAAFGAGDYAQAVGTAYAALGAGRLDEARAAFEHAHALDRNGREAEVGLMRVNAALRVREAAESRSRARAELEDQLQALVDEPQRLGSPAVRSEAVSLIREAEAAQPSSPVLRSLAARLAILLPQYDKPVHLALVSDNQTQVEISQIGSFGTFVRRDIDLKPGRYTVIGTRAGYREVRRDVTVAPGQGIQTISVRCQQPI